LDEWRFDLIPRSGDRLLKNKIVCEKCSAFAKHFIDTIFEGNCVSHRLCDKHYQELRKEQLLGSVKTKAAVWTTTIFAAHRSKIRSWRKSVEDIHTAAPRVVIVVTGGGSSAISELLSVPGGSRTLLEAVVPYSEEAFAEWLGRSPEHFCAEETALSMAAVARDRACNLLLKRAKDAEREQMESNSLPSSIFSVFDHAIGVACTASLVSDRPKKGEHRCYVATQAGAATASYSLVLEKGARDRAGEEHLAGTLILFTLARAIGLDDLPALDLRPGESLIEHLANADPILIKLLEGQRKIVWSLPDVLAESPSEVEKRGSKTTDQTLARGSSLHPSIPFPHSPPAGILCGSFHPLHFGHRQLREVAERILKGPVYYEMSIRNVDKPPLDFLSIARRRAQFTDVPLALTAAPTFAEKSAALPGVVFVVGVDTAERIVQPKYYGGSASATREALERIRAAGCRFLVAGRKDGERFETLADVQVPTEFADMFAAIPADEFRADVSSTQIRLES
jgi:hypothetical protein